MIFRSLAAAAGAQAFILVSGVIAARLLGVEGRGYWAGLRSIQAVIVVLSTLGIHGAAAYHMSLSPGRSSLILGEALRWAALQIVAATVLLAAIFYLWSQGRPADLQFAMWLALLTTPFAVVQLYMIRALQGLQHFDRANFSQLTVPAFYAVGAVVMLLLDERTISAFAMMHAATHIAAAAVSVWLVRSLIRPARPRSRIYRQRLLVFGLKSQFATSQPVEVLPIDQAAVATFLPATSAGLYAVAYAFTRLPRMVARGVSVVTIPTLAGMHDPLEGRRLMWRLFALNAALISVGVVAIWPFLGLLTDFLFGPEYAGAVILARILLVGTAFAAMRRVLAHSLVGLGSPMKGTLAELSMYPVLVVLGPLLGLLDGARGVAFAMSTAYGVSLLVALFFTAQLRSNLPRADGLDGSGAKA